MIDDINIGFTVLMSCYKNDDPIKFDSALLSIKNSTLKAEAVVLVVDGPIPSNIESVITKYYHILPLRVKRLPVNTGLALALNYGLTFVSTKYCIRADADDVNLPDRFSEIIQRLVSGVDLVGSYIEELDSLSNLYVATKYVPIEHHRILKYAAKRNPFNHMSVGFVTKKVTDVGCYPNIHLREDYGLWVKMLANGAVTCNIPKSLVHASAGTGMFRRRGGFSHVKAEIKMQTLLIQLGFKSPLRGLLDWFFKSVVFLMPSFLRKYVYILLLRGVA